MNIEELKKILADHKKWLYDEPGKKRAILQDADMKNAYLRGDNLRRADLCRADLRGADLREADLFKADLRGANLEDADLRDADLRGADLRGANLRRADISDADLRGADLQGADLREAFCAIALFANADLRGADLRGAYVWHAATDGMKTDAETIIDWPMECPETGSFIGWKKVGWKKSGEYIVKLEIPADAKRSSATTNKCRASMAKVLEIQNIDGTNADVTEIMTDRCWFYKVGEMVYPDSWDDNRWNECSHGIHFFMTREKAVAW